MSFAAIEAWLQSYTGLDAATLGSGTVARAAQQRMAALGGATVDEFLALLARSADERHALIDRVIVPETWFFRDGAAFDALARHAVETWGPAHPGTTLNVLSLPCSTGEEPYSLAIALDRAGWPLELLRIEAVDISRDSLLRARDGRYGRNSFRGDDQAYRDAYFDALGEGVWRIKDRLRAPVRFEAGNLLAEEFASDHGLYDAIFCRNLLIYFDRQTQARAIRCLEKLLAPGGWMAVGPAEPVLLFEHGFEALRIPAGFMLQRANKSPAPAVTSVRGRPAPARRSPAPSSAMPPTVKRAPDEPRRVDSIESVRALADAGRLREAAERGAALLARAGPSAELLYLLGVVAEAAGEAGRAEELYRKAVYLEPRHAEALSHLALLAEKNGDAPTARQFRRRAQRTPVP